jgi:hypothetical protein
MKTEQLIHVLAIDLAVRSANPTRPFWIRLFTVTSIAALPGLLVMTFVFSRSPHLMHGVTTTIEYTIAAALVLAVGAFCMAMALSRPEAKTHRGWILLPPLILAVGIGAELAHVPQTTWAARLWGGNPFACFASVLLLSLPILAGALITLRHGAPTRPRAAGAMAGLLAGGVAAALYTLHCPEDSLLFIAAWHVPAILTVSLLGAGLATRVLRW